MKNKNGLQRPMRKSPLEEMGPYLSERQLEEGGGRQRLKDMLLAESTLDYLVERTTLMKGGSA